MTRRRTDLGERLAALAAAVDLADGRLDPALVAEGRAVVHQAEARLGRNPERTVVALAGATGSGKSSLFNALVGDQLSAVGVRRPTTASAQAAVWGDGEAGPLLDWLEVDRRHQRPAGDGSLDGLVLLDLPDHDSTALDHRLVVDRLVGRADLLVWVLDPQKYADAAVHDRYLRRLGGHRDVVLVVLNQADRLDDGALRACLADVGRLLRDDGLDGVAVLSTSASTGAGLDRLRALLTERVGRRRAAVERLEADVRGVASRLAAACGDGAANRLRGSSTDAVVDALAAAAGVDVVADAVARSHRRDATARTGWPLTRWLSRLRPDPLRRLHLGRGQGGAVDRTSLPAASALERAEVDRATRAMAADLSARLPDPWPALVRRAAAPADGRLADALDRAVASTPLQEDRRPRWWGVVGAVQWLLALATVAGLVWLAVLFGLEWLQLPDPPLPRVREIPWPTVLLLGGAVAGLLLAAVSRRLAAVGAARRRRRARARLRAAVAAVAEAEVVTPARRELEAHDAICSHARSASA